jgi:hypothetical protein
VKTINMGCNSPAPKMPTEEAASHTVGWQMAEFFFSNMLQRDNTGPQKRSQKQILFFP